MWDIAVVIGMLGISFLLAYLGNMVGEEHPILKIFFIIMALFVAVILLGTLIDIVDVQLATGVSV